MKVINLRRNCEKINGGKEHPYANGEWYKEFFQKIPWAVEDNSQ